MTVRSLNKTFNNFLQLKKIIRYSRYTSKGAVLAKKFNTTIRNLSKKVVSEKGNASWIDEIDSTVNKYNNTVHSTNKMTPIQASLKQNEEYVHNNILDERNFKPKFKTDELVRTADTIFINFFSKG